MPRNESAGAILRHYMPKYRDEGGRLVVESWMQLNAFGRCFCFSRRTIRIGDPPEGGSDA